MPDMTPQELKRRLDNGEKIFVLDVREPHEYQTANIGGHLIPLNDLPKRVGELDPGQEIVVHCKLGGRSAKAVDFLRQSGFTNVHNLAGGIHAWSEKVDPKIPKY
jgi:adenylyltransferase/sulfurtransferase